MKTIQEINEKIKKGEVVVLTAEEMIDFVKEKGVKEAAKKVDIVTTGTFGPMCSSGMYLNLGHTKPRIKIGGGRCYLNNVPCYTGFAAVDIMLGATALPDNDPRNRDYPGEFHYGGGHIIHEFVKGENIELYAEGYGTDCYPRKELRTYINIKKVNEAVLFNLRNCYQNYNVAVNLSNKTIYTYMGMLKPKLGNANYCSAGQLSPLLKDPYYKTIGVGTKIFLGGGVGYIAWWGTQHNPEVPRTDLGIPKFPSGTLAVIGDLKQMSPEFLVGVSIIGYGVSLAVGIGIPIPILNEDIARWSAVSDEEIFAPIIDYSKDYPEVTGKPPLGFVSYKELRSGEITIDGRKVPTGSLSSYTKARQICRILKDWIKKGKFFLTEPVMYLPSVGSNVKYKFLE